jgi:electron transfer flavoprotein beta subunit
MRIVVAHKWAANPSDAAARPDGTVDWSRAKEAVSEYDPVAIEIGRRLADQLGAELIGLSVGGEAVGARMAVKAAAARGLDRLVLVADPALAGAPPERTAAVLAAAVRQIGDVDLVLTGDASVDVGARITHALLAGFLGWPALGEVESPAVDDGAATVSRTVATGAQTLSCPLPAVLAVAAGAAVPRVPGMRDILAADKKPVERLDLAALDVPPAVGAVEITGRAPAAPPARLRTVLEGDAAQAAGALIDSLRRTGVL